jgi:hypothetical protein
LRKSGDILLLASACGTDFHVGNTGSNPVGDANNFNKLHTSVLPSWELTAPQTAFSFLKARKRNLLRPMLERGNFAFFAPGQIFKDFPH